MDPETASWINSSYLQPPLPLPHPQSAATPKLLCATCLDPHPLSHIWQSPCSHNQCLSCLEDWFEVAMADRSLYPPTCCRSAIPWEDIRDKLPAELVARFEGRKEELDDLRPPYCHEESCGKYIPAMRVQWGFGIYDECGQTTCTACRGVSHAGGCPTDLAVEQTVTTAKEMGWTRCYACNAIVERNLGCRHILCRCGSEFCYNCGARWKTCDCCFLDDGVYDADEQEEGEIFDPFAVPDAMLPGVPQPAGLLPAQPPNILGALAHAFRTATAWVMPRPAAPVLGEPGFRFGQRPVAPGPMPAHQLFGTLPA